VWLCDSFNLFFFFIRKWYPEKKFKIYNKTICGRTINYIPNTTTQTTESHMCMF
jgi:hypothetical protein